MKSLKTYYYIRSKLAWLLIFGLLPVIQACSQDVQTFDEKLEQLYSDEVPVIEPKALHQKLAAGDSVVLLDTRKKSEYKVSHLKNAIWVGYDNFRESKVANIPKDQTIVTYCTVGYRSEKIGAYLEEQGFQNVYNLYGSIIGWVNAGLPVYNPQGKATMKVHTYSKEWGKWLKQGEAVYE